MSVGVSVIENGTQGAFPFIFCHYRGFQFTASFHHFRREFGIHPVDLFGVRLQKCEEIRVQNGGCFDDFRHSAEILAPRQSFQKIGINQNRFRLMKRSHQILSFRKIDSGFPADGGVHHGKKSRGNLEKINPSHINRRGKARHIPRDSTTQSKNQGFPVEFRPCRLPADLKNRSEMLGFLSGREGVRPDFRRARIQDGFHRSFRKQRIYIGVRHQKTASPFDLCGEKFRIIQNSAADPDRIGAVGEFHCDGFRVHASFPSVSFSLTSPPHALRRLMIKSITCCCSFFPEPSTVMIGSPNSK